MEVVALHFTAYRDAALCERLAGDVCIVGELFAQPSVGVSGGKRTDGLFGLLDGGAVGQAVEQVERSRPEVQRTLSRGDDGAPCTVALQADAAHQAAQPAADDDRVEFHDASSSVKCMSQTPAYTHCVNSLSRSVSPQATG